MIVLKMEKRNIFIFKKNKKKSMTKN